MSNERKLIDLFEYTYHFNAEMIKVIAESRALVDDKTISLINHTLNAQQIWNARILGETTFEVWQINPFESLVEINHTNFLKSIDIIRNFDPIKIPDNIRIQEEQSLKTLFLKCFFMQSTILLITEGKLILCLSRAA